VENSVSS